MNRIWTLIIVVFALAIGSTEAVARPDLPPADVAGQGPTFTLNPNPVTGSYFYVNLQFTEAQYPDAVIIVNDVLGKVVYSYPIRKSDYTTGQVRIDLGDAMLDKGVYFLQIKSGDSTKTLKLAIR
ncbi:MAG: T9SS type A sorting domain-containing protein [Bacteroidota bacterium]